MRFVLFICSRLMTRKITGGMISSLVVILVVSRKKGCTRVTAAPDTHAAQSDVALNKRGAKPYFPKDANAYFPRHL